jgi:hypothetical protein
MWAETSSNNVRTDCHLNSEGDLGKAKKKIKLEFRNAAWDHVKSLTVQGSLVTAITDALSPASVQRWSGLVNTLPVPLICFVRKALQLQLPTLSNLVRWKRSQSAACPLCHQDQTNKHVLNNCSSPIVLERYKNRHNGILLLLGKWLQSVLDPTYNLFIDLVAFNQNTMSAIFKTLRPDIAIVSSSGNILIWELTICHESNIVKSRNYKLGKYAQLAADLIERYKSNRLIIDTIEVTSLGLLSDTSAFTKNIALQALPLSLTNNITKSVINSSYEIYRKRNSVDYNS